MECTYCHHEFTLVELMGRPKPAHVYEANVFLTTCPACSKDKEFQIENGFLLDGYIYAAARAHFCAVGSVRFEDMAIEERESEFLIRCGSEEWRLPRETPRKLELTKLPRPKASLYRRLLAALFITKK